MKPLNWNDIPSEQMNPRLARRVIHTGSMTIARLSLKAGALVPLHSHHNEQVTMVESGLLKFLLPGGEVLVGPGQVLELPPQLQHGVEVLEDSQVTDLFTPRREDWIHGDDAYLRDKK
ncbi:MAG: cupin domain-containing protein [Candidatus Solibacter usitatus]|nr:cupin domain-containing protein [Candidatus Solibacter usitatus]